MFDLRPVGYVVGWLVLALGAMMGFPLAIDIADGNGEWHVFLRSMLLTVMIGAALALACANAPRARLSRQQTFLLTSGVWLALPVFGALPFIFGATEADVTDAFFEAMSGLTTTGATVFSGLDGLPRGLLLWRGMLQWFGGVGIIVVAMVFLPELRIGGMQIFRTEGFDTFGKILPRATQIAQQISAIYIGLTANCAMAYGIAGMGAFDATVHAMTTIATGGFANYDASFGAFGPAVEYVASVFMVLAALPFVRYIQLVAGSAQPLWRDSQVQAFFVTLGIFVLAIAAWRMAEIGTVSEQAFRQSLFNTASLLTGTGYASTDYWQWGGFGVVALFLAGLVGGCAGSTSCSIKVFRYQLLLASINAQVRRIHSPRGVATPRYGGRPVSDDVLNSVMTFFVVFFTTLGVLAVLLALTGLDLTTAVSGAVAALGNIGPGLGAEIGPSGNYAGLNDSAKWLLAAAMLVGRLELMVVFVLFTAEFWRG